MFLKSKIICRFESVNHLIEKRIENGTVIDKAFINSFNPDEPYNSNEERFFREAFFVIKCIGLCEDFDPLKGIVSGILESVAGVCSLYICYGQILNEHFQITLLPSIPLKKDNEIDDYAIKRE